MKPVAGVLEATSLAAGGIQVAAGERSGITRGTSIRRRKPRVFYGADRMVKPYSHVDAWINESVALIPGLNWYVICLFQADGIH